VHGFRARLTPPANAFLLTDSVTDTDIVQTAATRLTVVSSLIHCSVQGKTPLLFCSMS